MTTRTPWFFWLQLICTSCCRKRRVVAEPEAAFGPPGSSGEENISVVVAPIQSGVQLTDLGSAEQAGKRFLETNVASINANREAKLLFAQSRSVCYCSRAPDCCKAPFCGWILRYRLLQSLLTQRGLFAWQCLS